MEKLTDDSFALVREVASGKACLGEKAGHSQVSIWRNWRLDDDNSLQCILDRSAANGKAIAVNSDALPTNPNITVQAYKHDHGSTCAGTGLLLPTSICSGQVAQLITDQLNYTADDNALIKQYTSLVHTEGCGCSSGLNVDLLMRSFASYIQHPDILRSCLLEHGCEKVHNQYLLDYLEKHNIKTAPIGHASIQLDGGIQAVSEKVRGWFQDEANSDQAPTSNTCPLSDFIVAFDMQSHLDNESQRAFIDLIALYLSAGSTVIIPSTSPLLESQLFSELLADEIRCSLEYGQQASDAGLHVMRCTGRVSAENISGLAASGAQLICMHIDILPISGHPFVPVLQFAKDERIIDRFEDDIDGQAKDNWFDLSIACLTRKYQSHCSRMQLHQFQMSRGETGISM